jgi:hypothetical protein
MTGNRMTTMATRWWITVVACSAFAASAPAQPARTAPIDGVYNGSYAGDQGPTNFKLTLTLQGSVTLTGVFTFYPPGGSGTTSYTCDVVGRYIQASRQFQLRRSKWESVAPTNLSMMGMNGTFDPDGGQGAGQIMGKMRDRPSPTFEAIRDAAESAAMAPVIADKQNGSRAASSPVRAAGEQRAASKPAAAPAAVPNVNSPAAIDGIYTGTYGSNADDNVRAKLYLKSTDDGSVNGTLSGLFTFDVPPSLGAKPITYTYKLIGVYEPGNTYPFQFWSAKPLGNPAPDAYAMKRVGACFAKGPVFKNGYGELERTINPDQISGQVIGSNDRISNSFEAVRDKAESAQLDSLMAAQGSATGPSVNTTAPAAPVVRPSIDGVFNGTYTRANEPPTRFELTITQTRDGLAGVATIYLPTDSGTKPYTYSLKGAQVPYAQRDFELKVYDWETIPPKDFTNFKAMGFKGTFLSNMTQNTARIISVKQASPSDVIFFVPTFEATWDATESADIKGAIAAQEAVGTADQAAALKAHAEAVKNAQPKQLASKDLVRKSQAYWGGYRSDFIREVFDGGFASDVDNDPAFQSLFTDYVDLFSNTCAAYLPADHKTITITTVTTRGGLVIGTTSKTVEMDSRFVAKYVEYSGVDPAPGSEQEKEQTEKTIAIAGQIFHAGGPSHGTSFADANALLHLAAAHGLFGGSGMDKFFATELKATGPSAALRQMGENLLRGGTGEPSLQEAGAKIDGAEAETDKDLPPGRFAHLIDAANAFYREPANIRLRSRFETAFDETLAAKYRGIMTRDEEYYYANDFEHRFRDQIMQPRAYCEDPEWPRLHPAVEECIAELQ